MPDAKSLVRTLLGAPAPRRELEVDQSIVMDALALTPSSLPAAQYSNRPATNIQTSQIANGAVTPDKQSTTARVRMLLFGLEGPQAAAGTFFKAPGSGLLASGSSPQATEDPNGSMVMTEDGTLKELRVRIGGPCAGANSMVLTLRLNGVDQLLTLTWDNATGAGAQTLTIASDVAFLAGDRISCSIVKTGANGTNTAFTATLEYIL